MNRTGRLCQGYSPCKPLEFQKGQTSWAFCALSENLANAVSLLFHTHDVMTFKGPPFMCQLWLWEGNLSLLSCNSNFRPYSWLPALLLLISHSRDGHFFLRAAATSLSPWVYNIFLAMPMIVLSVFFLGTVFIFCVSAPWTLSHSWSLLICLVWMNYLFHSWNVSFDSEYVFVVPRLLNSTLLGKAPSFSSLGGTWSCLLEGRHDPGTHPLGLPSGLLSAPQSTWEVASWQ